MQEIEDEMRCDEMGTIGRRRMNEEVLPCAPWNHASESDSRRCLITRAPRDGAGLLTIVDQRRLMELLEPTVHENIQGGGSFTKRRAVVSALGVCGMHEYACSDIVTIELSMTKHEMGAGNNNI